MRGRACKTFHYNKGLNTAQISKCVIHFNSRGERYWAPHRGLEELDTVCIQDKNHTLKLSVRPLLWPGLLTPLALSNLWFDGQVLITYKMVWLLRALSMSQRGTVKGNYVQAKLLNGQWKWEFQLFLTTCLLMLWHWVFFRLMRFLIDGFRQETNKKLMERIGDGLVHGQYSLTRDCDYSLWVLQRF